MSKSKSKSKSKKLKKDKKIPVLLLEDLPNLGQKGEVVSVRPGYFRYLITQNKAVLATKKKLETELKPFILEEKIKLRESYIHQLKEKIEKISLQFKINKYTSLTKNKIVEALKENGFSISKGKIELKEKINQPGDYNLLLHLGYNITANLKVKVLQD